MVNVWESTAKATSTARTTSTTKAMRKEKKVERKAKEKDKEKTRSQRRIRVSKATAGHVASGGTRRVSVGKGTYKPWRKSRVLPRVQWLSATTTPAAAKAQQRLFNNSMMNRNQDGSSA